MYEYWEEDKAMGKLLYKLDEMRAEIVANANVWYIYFGTGSDIEKQSEAKLLHSIEEYRTFCDKHHFDSRR